MDILFPLTVHKYSVLLQLENTARMCKNTDLYLTGIRNKNVNIIIQEYKCFFK